MIINIILILFYLSFPFLFKRHFIFIFFLWFSHLTAILSNLYIEGGIYIAEQQSYSFSTGSTTSLLLYNILFFMSIFVCLRVIPRYLTLHNSCRLVRSCDCENSISKKIIFFLYLVIFLLYLNLFLTGIPLFSSEISRFNFWDYAVFPWLQKIIGATGAPIAVVLGVIFAVEKNDSTTRTFALSGFILLLVYFFLAGNKFSRQLLTLYFFFCPYLFIYFTLNNEKKRRRLIFKVSLSFVFAVVLLIVFVSYQYKYGGYDIAAGGTVFNALKTRIFALQGHVWWGTHYEVIYLNNWGLKNLKDMFTEGMETMMMLVAPRVVADGYLDHNIRFTMAYPAIGLYVFGKYGLAAFQIFSGVLYSCVILLAEKKIIKHEVVESSILMFMLYLLYHVYTMADFYIVWSPKFVVSAFLLLFLLITRYSLVRIKKHRIVT